jgi:phosphatidylglycerol lysyltransferase
VCRQQDWIPAFWQVREECAELYRSCGLHLLKIGEDAVIRTDGFTLKGKAMANVRSSARRAEKEGVRVVFYRGQIEHAEQLFQMQLISWSWLASKGGSEMGFSMGHFDIREEDDRQVSALVVDGTNRVHAFVTFIPIYGRHGWGLDLMRRAEQAAPGCMELLLSCSIDYLKSTGAEMVSLGLAPMSKVNQQDQTALDSIIDFLTQRYGYLNQSQSLFKFKQKFQPSWESRYLVYPHSSHLPKIGWALYAAHQQDTSLIALTRRSMRNWQRKLLAGTRRKTGPREVVTHPGTGQLAI